MENEPVNVREQVRAGVKLLIEMTAQTNETCEVHEDPHTISALAFLYQEEARGPLDASTQFSGYLAEPQLRFDLNPFEWWKMREIKYPAIAPLARKYLAIPATSVSSERCFSTAGNVVTSKRSCLLPENVDMLVFLYQNRAMYL